jgi:hypothetical protein
MSELKLVQTVQPVRSVQATPSSFPAAAGKERGGVERLEPLLLQ